jgi:hypothetical protein
VTFSAASYDAEIFKEPLSAYGVAPGFDLSKILFVMGGPTDEAPGVYMAASFTLPYSHLDGEYPVSYIPAPPFITPDYDPGGPSPTGPAIFVLQPGDPAQPAVLNQDSSVNSSSNPAAVGSILQIFATGYGPLDASQGPPVQAYLGGMPAGVIHSAPSAQYAGLWQINAQLPSGLSGQISLYLIAGPIASNGVTVWVQ